MAPTPDQMTTELTARLDGPHTEEDTAAAARLVAEAVRFLNYATAGGAGLSYLATAYTVAGGTGQRCGPAYPAHRPAQRVPGPRAGRRAAGP